MAFGRKKLGTGWGGARVGSGPKPRAKAATHGLVSFPGGQPVDRALVEPPADLPKAQASCWREWALLALERRTLTAETVPALKLLCELEVRRRQIAATLDMEGAEPSPMGLRVFAQYTKQVEGLMGRFCLAPFGKPVAAEKPKAVSNPFAAFGNHSAMK